MSGKTLHQGTARLKTALAHSPFCGTHTLPAQRGGGAGSGGHAAGRRARCGGAAAEGGGRQPGTAPGSGSGIQDPGAGLGLSAAAAAGAVAAALPGVPAVQEAAEVRRSYQRAHQRGAGHRVPHHRRHPQHGSGGCQDDAQEASGRGLGAALRTRQAQR